MSDSPSTLLDLIDQLDAAVCRRVAEGSSRTAQALAARFPARRGVAHAVQPVDLGLHEGGEAKSLRARV